MSHGRRHAVLRLRDRPLIDTFTFFGPSDTPAVLTMTITWEALEDPVALGAGATVPPTDPAAFLGRFARARSTAHFAGRQLGFSFRSDPGASADDGHAKLGTERNGVFL
jgi:hypothetical protein